MILRIKDLNCSVEVTARYYIWLETVVKVSMISCVLPILSACVYTQARP
jgi:hypothetical protein